MFKVIFSIFSFFLWSFYNKLRRFCDPEKAFVKSPSVPYLPHQYWADVRVWEFKGQKSELNSTLKSSCLNPRATPFGAALVTKEKF